MDAFQLLEDSGHVAPPDDATVEAAVDLVLADAFHERDALADALSIRRGQRRVPRRRAYLAGAAAVLAAAAATAIPLSLGGGTSSAAPVLKLASYSLRLPTQYRLTAAAASTCGPPMVIAAPASGQGTLTSPSYGLQVDAAGNAAGGCIFMVLAPPYTPTASQPDPEAFFRDSQHVQVGPYVAFIWTGSLTYSRAPGDGPVETMLFVEIPLSGGQQQDLVVGEEGLSQSQLITLVANGLSVSPGTSTSTSAPSGSTGPSDTPAGNSGTNAS